MTKFVYNGQLHTSPPTNSYVEYILLSTEFPANTSHVVIIYPMRATYMSRISHPLLFHQLNNIYLVDLYVCKTWLLTLRDERRLRGTVVTAQGRCGRINC